MDLEQRIAHLERRSQVLTGLLGFCTLLLVTGVLTAARRAWQVPDELVTRSLRVVGKNGKNQASLAATPDGFISLSFRDLNDSLRFTALMTPSGKVSLAWFGGHGARQTLGVVDGPKGEEFSLVLKDRDGKVIWQPPVTNPY